MREIKITLSIPEAKFIRHFLNSLITFLTEFKIYNHTVMNIEAIIVKIDNELLKE